MFPSLYPIALIFSRLTAFDFRVTAPPTPTAVIPLSDVTPFYDLFISSINHKNYLGRLIISQALKSLVDVYQIIHKVNFNKLYLF